jgi:hypothetical protein
MNNPSSPAVDSGQTSEDVLCFVVDEVAKCGKACELKTEPKPSDRTQTQPNKRILFNSPAALNFHDR